jgi:hypothetical protein
MPTRFPTGLNILPGRHALNGLSTPHAAGQWATWFSDFHTTDGLTFLPSGGVGSGGLGTAASAVAHQGVITLTSDATAVGVTVAYHNGTAVNSPAAAHFLQNATEWIIACRLSMSATVLGAWWFGIAAAANIDSAGVPQNLSAAAPSGSAFLFRKAGGSANVVADMYSGGVASMTQQTILAAASQATATGYRFAAHYRRGSLRMFFNDALVATVASPTVHTAAAAMVLGCASDGTTAASRTVQFDYGLISVKSART